MIFFSFLIFISKFTVWHFGSIFLISTFVTQSKRHQFTVQSSNIFLNVTVQWKTWHIRIAGGKWKRHRPKHELEIYKKKKKNNSSNSLKTMKPDLFLIILHYNLSSKTIAMIHNFNFYNRIHCLCISILQIFFSKLIFMTDKVKL